MDITEDYVSFEVAKLLKEKEFNENCFALYNPNEELIQCGVRLNNTQVGRVEGSYSAPTLQMAMKWLREVHNIAICICAYYSVNPYELNYRNNKPYWKIRIMNHVFSRDYGLFNTYEESCEAAIKCCLENLMNK